MKKLPYIIAAIALSALTYFVIQRNSSEQRKKITHCLTKKIEELQPQLEKLFNTKAEIFPDEGVIKISFPRKDSIVSIDNWPLDPFMGLTSWIGFQSDIKENAMAMGDLVLLEDEVNPVMSMALENDIQVTALHNHFLYDSPKVYFMHIEAEGALPIIAGNINKVLNAIKNIPSRPKIPFPTHHAINGELLEKIISVKGSAQDGMFKVVIGRQIQARDGCIVGKNMGVNTWAAFGGTDDNAIVDGDFAVLEDELQAVLKALRAADIFIVAIHNHMTHENPRMLFLHFWGHAHAAALAQGIKNALDKINTLKPALIHMKNSHCHNQ